MHPFLAQTRGEEEEEEEEGEEEGEDWLSAKAVTTYVPHVFLGALREATHPRGRCTQHLRPAAQAQQQQQQRRWEVQWPQLECAAAYTHIVRGGDGALAEELLMDAAAVGDVDGVRECACPRDRHIVWTRAVLRQRGGGEGEGGGAARSVVVEFVPWTGVSPEEKRSEVVESEEKEEEDDDDDKQKRTVLLTPGRGANGGLPRAGGGMGFPGSEEYWEGLRRRNGHLGAVWRGWWRTATTSATTTTPPRNASYAIAKSCRIS
jgi:hypothetical protein